MTPENEVSPPAGLAAAVQRLADIADARHAGELTMCSYLLQMREFYRWQSGLPLTQEPRREDVGRWIAAREEQWQRLEDEAFGLLPAIDEAGGPGHDPFDVATVNAALAPRGCLYGAGRIGARDGGRPVFFLAVLERRQWRDGVEVIETGREFARGLVAPPAALTGRGEGPVVIRREALARWGWQVCEAQALRRSEVGAWQAAAAHYRIADQGFEAVLPRWLEDQVEIAVLHELGEHRFSRRRGEAWTTMRQALPGGRAEAHAVAVRDHLADLASTLPVLLDRGDAGPLHAWFANFDGVRAALFPRLATAYAAWRRGNGSAVLRDAVASGRAHFEALADRVLAAAAEDRRAAEAAGPVGAESTSARELLAPAATCV